jgi:hypothetical protein
VTFLPDPTWRARGEPREYPRNYPSLVQRKKQLLAELGNLEVGVKRDIKGAFDRFGYLIFNAAAAALASPELQAYFKGLSQALDPNNRKSGIPSSAIIDAYREIGLAAQRSVRAAYAARSPQRDLPAYRTTAKFARNRRYANGALLRAIGAPDFFEASAKGLKFINEDRLNREAKHWRRLNFGTAGGNTVSPPREFRLDWGKLLEAASPISVGLTPDIRPAFRIPRGVWISPGVFYPMSEIAGVGRTGAVVSVVGSRSSRGGFRRPGRVSPRQHLKESGRPTRGIASTNFLDAGVAAIARNLLPKFSEVYLYYEGKALPTTLNQRIRPRTPPLPKGNVRRAYRSSGYSRGAGETY